MSMGAPTQTATKRLLGRLWRDWLRPHLGLMMLNFAAIIVVAVTTSAYPLIISWAYDAFEQKSHSALYWVPLLVVVATGLRGGALYLQLVLTNRVLSTAEAEMQRAMYEKLIDADLARLAQEAPAALAARFTADITYVRLAMQGLITTALRDAATLVGIFCAMLWLDWVLTLCAMAVFPIAAWPLEAIGRRVRGIARSTQEQVGVMTALVNESLGGVRLAKTYRLEAYLKRKATGAFEELRELKVRAANQRALIDPLLEVLGGLAVAGVLLFIGFRILAGESSVGEFTASWRRC